MLRAWQGWMNRERKRRKHGGAGMTARSWKGESKGETAKRVMAGGRGESSSCQDRGRTGEEREGEKLSSVTLRTPLSAEESGVCRLMCVSTSSYGARCAGRSERWCQAPRLVHGSDWEAGGVSAAIAPEGALLARARQPACLPAWPSGSNLWMRPRKWNTAGWALAQTTSSAANMYILRRCANIQVEEIEYMNWMQNNSFH